MTATAAAARSLRLARAGGAGDRGGVCAGDPGRGGRQDGERGGRGGLHLRPPHGQINVKWLSAHAPLAGGAVAGGFLLRNLPCLVLVASAVALARGQRGAFWRWALVKYS